jgi:hypothetical protein
MARLIGVRARDWRGIWRWHPAPFEILPAGPVEVYDMRGQRPRPMLPYHLKPYLAALELVAMMSLATRALEGDL